MALYRSPKLRRHGIVAEPNSADSTNYNQIKRFVETTLHVATYNIHKGMSVFNRRHVLPKIRQQLAVLGADIVCLQEVQGAHLQRAARFADWPLAPQHEALAGDAHHAYGLNASYASGHHGNALISRFPILASHNVDISVNRMEHRGLLHCALQIHSDRAPLDVLCVHLNLRAADRRKQLTTVCDYIHDMIGDATPLILAGDFNDWRGEACDFLQQNAKLYDAFRRCHGAVARTFPANLPVLTLDRIYVRGLVVEHAMQHRNDPWQRLSDHIPLSSTMRLPALHSASASP